MTKDSPFKCRNGCDTMIYLDPKVTSHKGKMIPLELESGLPHDCPNTKREHEEFIGDTVMNLENKERGQWGY